MSYFLLHKITKDKKIVFVSSLVYVINGKHIKSANTHFQQIGNSSCWFLGHAFACQQAETIEEVIWNLK